MELTKVKRMDWQVVRRAEVDDYPGHFHVSEIIQYEIFCGQLLLPCLIFSRFIYVSVYFSTSFLFVDECYSILFKVADIKSLSS